MNINNVTLTGNLTRDPELRSTQSGTSVLQFGVAVNDRVKNGQGDWVDRPNYIDCTMFGARAESLHKLLRKGSKVGIVGKLHWSQWEKDGQKRSKVEVWPETVELLTPKANGAQNGSQKEMGTVQAEDTFGVHMEPVQDYLYEDSDLPF